MNVKFITLLLIVCMNLVHAKTEIIGHRGAGGHAPENTLESLQMAWACGAQGAECDILMTKDGKVILMHDDSTLRTSNGVMDCKIVETPYDEIKDLDVGFFKGPQWKGVKIPKLQDVVDAIPAGKKLFIEIKSGDTNEGADFKIVDPLLAIIESERVDHDKIVFISFDHAVIAELKRRAPQYQGLILTTHTPYPGTWPEVANESDVDKYIQEAKEIGAEGLDMEFAPNVTQSVIDKIHRAGLKVAIWSYHQDDTLESAKKMADFGVDYYTSDYPQESKEVIRSQ